MRSHRSWCVIFSASFSTLVSLAAVSAHAQLTSPSAIQGPGDMQMPSMPSTAMVSPPQAPQLPGLVAPAFNGYGNLANDNGYGSAVNPASFNQFSNPGGPMQATNVQQEPQSRLRDANSGSNAQQPNVGYGAPGAYRNTAMQQQTFPPGYGPTNPYAAQQMQAQMQGPLPPSQLRNAPNSGGYANQQPGNYQQTVVSGDPRFVMQAPLGNYPTTPYRPQFRTVSYQLPQQSPVAQPVQPPSALANQSAVLPNSTTLPQYQPTVGQLTNYQALQPGYNCAPGMPSNGVPAFVPGAVAPPTLPPNLTPQMYSPDNSGYRPLFSLGQENYNVQLGRGIIGQPTVYVTGQPIRNFLRYLSP